MGWLSLSFSFTFSLFNSWKTWSGSSIWSAREQTSCRKGYRKSWPTPRPGRVSCATLLSGWGKTPLCTFSVFEHLTCVLEFKPGSILDHRRFVSTDKFFPNRRLLLCAYMCIIDWWYFTFLSSPVIKFSGYAFHSKLLAPTFSHTHTNKNSSVVRCIWISSGLGVSRRNKHFFPLRHSKTLKREATWPV